MSPNDSRYLLPMNSLLFKSSLDLGKQLPTSPTLVDIRDAADTSVTALPMSPPAPENKAAEPKKGLWHRMVAKIKTVFGGKDNMDESTQEEHKELLIGTPTDFQHHITGGFGTLRTPTTPDRPRTSEDAKWEDMGGARRI
jgi:hypothetical protein